MLVGTFFGWKGYVPSGQVLKRSLDATRGETPFTCFSRDTNRLSLRTNACATLKTCCIC